MQKCVEVDINTSHLGVNPEKDINDAINFQSKEGFALKIFQIDSGTSSAFLIFEKI